MPTMPVLIGGAAGALITFLMTTGRRWWWRRRLAEDAARSLAPQLEKLSTAVTEALATYSWEPVERLDLTDHCKPRLTKQLIGGLRQPRAEPFADGVLAIHELDRARDTVALVAPDERERVEGYRRRITVASAIASAMADGRALIP